MTVNVERRAKVRKIVLWVGGFFVLLLLAAVITGYILERNMPAKLKSLVSEETHGVYSLDFSGMNISLWRGAASLESPSLVSDTTVYHGLPDSLQSEQLFGLEAKQLRIGGVSILKFLISKDIDISRIQLERPTLTVTRMKKDTTETDSAEQGLYQQVPEFLREAKVGEIRIDSLALQLKSLVPSETRPTSQTGRFSILVKGLDLDSAALAHEGKVLFAQDIQLSSQSLRLEQEEGMYDYGIKELYVSTREKVLRLSQFRCRPLYPEMEFSRKLVYRGDRFNALIPQLSIEDLDFKEMEREGTVKASKVHIDSAFLQIFVNKAMPEDPKGVPAEFPALVFQKLSIPVEVDSIYIKQSAIYYREYNPDAKQTGEVSFQRLNGTISNLTNKPSLLEADKWVHFRLNTYFLNTARLNLDIDIDMTDKDAALKYSGNLAANNLKFANSTLLEPLAMVKIEEGSMQSLHFDIAGNRFGAQSNVTASYKDLKVAMLKEDDGEAQKRGLISLLANWFKVKSNNPAKEGEEPRHSSVTYEHPQGKSFFNLLWKALLEGLSDQAMR